jgi:hypothetical protein
VQDEGEQEDWASHPVVPGPTHIGRHNVSNSPAAGRSSAPQVPVGGDVLLMGSGGAGTKGGSLTRGAGYSSSGSGATNKTGFTGSDHSSAPAVGGNAAGAPAPVRWGASRSFGSGGQGHGSPASSLSGSHSSALDAIPERAHMAPVPPPSGRQATRLGQWVTHQPTCV